jgi:hypothetical protein
MESSGAFVIILDKIAVKDFLSKPITTVQHFWIVFLDKGTVF